MTLCLSLGIKKATTTVIAHPALMLTPVFSFWTFGPPTSGGCCAYKKAEPKIYLSFKLTWINSLLTLCGSFGVVAIYETVISIDPPWDLSYLDSGVANSIFAYFLIITLPLFALAAICLLLIQFLDRCSCCCCKCFKENCLPMTEKVVYDTENPLSY